ncbi:MAG: hypothetical protein ACTHNU_10400 [Gaiellales bacterium]
MREARDALVLVAAAAPVVVIVSVILGAALGGYLAWQRWLTGSVIVAALLLGTLAAALLLVDRAGSRLLNARPHTVHRVPLIGAALVAGLLLVAGIPTTWPIVIGFALVCLVLCGLLVVIHLLNL